MWLQRSFRAMGSPCEIQLFAASRPAADRIAQLAIAEIERLEARYSRFRPDSLLARINRVAAEGGSIEVDAETAAILDYAATCYRESGGRFDVSSGILRRAWRFDLGELPDPDAIERLLAVVGFEKLRWQSPRLEFPIAGMELDLGGIVEEYAADAAATRCREAGASGGMLNLGGDVCLFSARPDGRPWRIGIRHPRRPGELLGSVELHAGALATSGDYERCIEVGGQRYGHILQPATGWPLRHLASVSAVAPRCVVAGSAATIAMLMEQEGPAWLAAQGLPHLWVDVHGEAGGTLLRGASD